jgi:hypothetical protein
MLRLAVVSIVSLCLLLVASVPPECSHDVSTPGFCSRSCVLQELASPAATLTLSAPAVLRPDAVAVPVACAGDDASLDPVRNPNSPRAPPES